MNLIVIDPGTQGAIVTKTDEGVTVLPMPKDEMEAARYCHRFIMTSTDVKAYIEQVGGYIKPPKDAKPPCPHCHQQDPGPNVGSQMFTFGENVGVIKGAIMGCGIRPEEINPRVWQKPFLHGVKMEKPQRKNTLKEMAQRLHPSIEVTLQTADALMILQYILLTIGAVAPPLELEQCQDSQILNEAAQLNPALFVADWDGSYHVFKRAEKGGVDWVRKASPTDIINLPFESTKQKTGEPK